MNIHSSEIDQKNKLKNIILITFDAFNYKLFIKNLESLPNLKKIIDNGVFFKYAFSCGPMTKFSFPSITGSIFPYAYGIKIPSKVDTLDSVLKKNGYNTALINESQAFLTPYFGYSNFDYSKNFLEHSHTKIDRAHKNIFLTGINNDMIKESKYKHMLVNHLKSKIKSTKIKRIYQIVKSTIKFLNLFFITNYENYKDRKKLFDLFVYEIKKFINEEFREPQFLWIHTIVNHLPYLPYNTLKFSEKKINYLNYRGISHLVNSYCANDLKSLFIESLKTTDKLIEIIMSNLEKNNYLKNSIVIITADHGEEFMEEGYFGHLTESSSDILLRIPLIFYSPNYFKNKIISTPVSTIDVLPTITDLLNIQMPETAQGSTLKKFLLNNILINNEEEKFWWRPMYSAGWRTDNLFDLRPGFNSKERVFTVRLNKYKLKVKQVITDNKKINNMYLLTNWVDNKILDLNKNIILTKELKKLLSKHLSEQILLDTSFDENHKYD